MLNTVCVASVSLISSHNLSDLPPFCQTIIEERNTHPFFFFFPLSQPPVCPRYFPIRLVVNELLASLPLAAIKLARTACNHHPPLLHSGMNVASDSVYRVFVPSPVGKLPTLSWLRSAVICVWFFRGGVVITQSDSWQPTQRCPSPPIVMIGGERSAETYRAAGMMSLYRLTFPRFGSGTNTHNRFK